MDTSLRETRERERKQRESAGEREQEFSRVVYSEKKVGELRKKHMSKGLTSDESLSIILMGNQEHVNMLEELGLSPNKRHEAIVEGKADYLVIACSDARIPRLDSEDDQLIGIQVRIAGNVVPKKGSPSFQEISDAVSMLKPDGLVVVEGHCKCGACAERVKWVEKGMPDTGSAELNNLLHEVFGSTPDENAMAQLTKARDTIPTGDRATGALVYDWEKGGIQIVSANHSPILEILVDNWNRRHTEAFEEGKLSQRLAKHRPHAIAVGTNDLPYSLATIMHAKQNEIFSTTGSETGLDDMDKASILYAIEHLGVRHIPFVAPGTVSDNGKLREMFEGWETQMKEMSVGGHKLIGELIDKGELKISWLRYDLGSGSLVSIGGPAVTEGRKEAA
ncbi:MAG TPA: carbonic anhydrase [Candidatus Bilamarchaeum sp.]|nr:carbonic anhydrase [Candidatus Bilamarchaeum sp.]